MRANTNMKDIPLLGRLISSSTDMEASSEDFAKKRQMIERYVKDLDKDPEALQNFVSISRNLSLMGYKQEIFTACFLIHKFKTLEEAIDILGKTDDLWNHRYINYSNGLCFICNEYEESHRTLINIIQRKNTRSSDYPELSKKPSSLWRFPSSQISEVKKQESVEKLCNICLSLIIKGDDFCLKCNHKFCKPCMQSYLEEEIRNARVLEIHCPEVNCPEVFDEEIIKALIDENTHAKYKKFAERERIKNDKNLILCPFPNCEGFARRKKLFEKDIHLELENAPLLQKGNINTSYELEKEKCTCSLGHEICGKCMRIWHEDECIEDKELKEDSEAIKAVLKRCPRCQIPIYKFAGCNHMTCSCSYQFCWLCQQEYEPEHYNHPDTPCYGQQFDQNDLEPEGNLPEGVLIHNEVLSSFTFLFEWTIVGVHTIIRGNAATRKGLFFVIILFITFFAWILSSLLNLFFIIYMLHGSYKLSQLPSPNCARMIYSFTFSVLFFLLYIPGIIISTIWFILTTIYAIVTLILL